MKKSISLLILLFLIIFSYADSGMWLPVLLKQKEAEMQKLGFKLTAEDVYSVNHSSMKDAVVLFGGGCTAEVISKKGLLLTNHHCGYSYIQRYSTMENNILQNGFWAASEQDEIPCEGLYVTFLIYMEEVTNDVLQGVENATTLQEREDIIAKNIKTTIAQATEGTDYVAEIKSFYYGNQYYIFVNRVFHDVRLVGTPPESIGKFGGDTDNWVWPRHTGDFSLYRVYADKNGEPVRYNPDNIPLKTETCFPISLKGIDEGDFTLVFGFPGTTQQYLISDGVDLVVNYRNPPLIHQRGARLDVMKKYMALSPEIRLMYAAKANSIANGWKKSIGESKGIKETNTLQRKANEEKDLEQHAYQTTDMQKRYQILTELKTLYQTYRELETKSVTLRETFQAIELGRFIESVRPLLKESYPWSEDVKANLLKKAENFYLAYYKPIDKEVFVELLDYYFNTTKKDCIPETLQKYVGIERETLQNMAKQLYDNSVFSSFETFKKFITSASKKEIATLHKWLNDNSMFLDANEALTQLNKNSFTEKTVPNIRRQIDAKYRDWVKYAVLDTTGKYFPDANLSLRVAFGKMEGFSPYNGMLYLPYTTVDGILQKEDPDIFDYVVDRRLKDLISNKDFGPYTDANGEMRVAFIASNHTTGGNSGSPVLNGNGELVGVNYDRVWEGTMSDLNYDITRCRNISLDIRYFLFIVDKYANAQNLIAEMEIRK
ncbi:MAG: S46 family peptidase [Bacteroidetes bacterium]|nr:S46 family peptidase [Bacteroidota bacterium]MCL1968218.1 S46 family peptidase [Bacteroidota bacterium]